MSAFRVRDVLATADRISQVGAQMRGAIAAARLGLVLEPPVDPRPMIRAAIREVIGDAAAIALVLRLALVLVDDEERDTLTDQQEGLLRSLVTDLEPRPLVALRVVELAEQQIAQIVRAAGDVVLPTGIDEPGHDAAPSVGADGVGSSSLTGSTVGVGPDAPVEASPSPAGASVRGRVIARPRLRLWVDDSDVLHAACDECRWVESNRGLVGHQFEDTVLYHRKQHRAGVIA